MSKTKKKCKHINKKHNKSDKKSQRLKEIKLEQNIKNRKINKITKEIEAKFIEFYVNYINDNYPNLLTYNNLRKFILKEILEDIIYFLKSGVSYKNFRGKLSKSTLHYYISLFTKKNIFISNYWCLHKEYSKNNFYDKIKYLSTDTTFIINKSSSLKNVKRNPYMKNKNCIKISYLADKEGIPLDIMIKTGNLNDSPMLREHLTNLKIDIKTKELKNNNRYKQYFLADGIYNSTKNINFLKEKGFIPILSPNKRNSHTEPVQLTNNEKIIYKKRIIVENAFAKLKQYKRINNLYEKRISVYTSLVYLSLSHTLFKKMNIINN